MGKPPTPQPGKALHAKPTRRMRLGAWLRANWYRGAGIVGAPILLAYKDGNPWPSEAMGAFWAEMKVAFSHPEVTGNEIFTTHSKAAWHMIDSWAVWSGFWTWVAVSALLAALWWFVAELPAGWDGPFGHWVLRRQRARGCRTLEFRSLKAAMAIGLGDPHADPKKRSTWAHLQTRGLNSHRDSRLPLKRTTLNVKIPTRGIIHVPIVGVDVHEGVKAWPGGMFGGDWWLPGIVGRSEMTAAKEKLEGTLRLPRPWHAPVDSSFEEDPDNTSMIFRQWVRYDGLPDTKDLRLVDDLDPYDIPVVVTPWGQHCWPRREEPHFKIEGRSGMGKGIELQQLKRALLARGNLVIVIDGQGAAEHLDAGGINAKLRPVDEAIGLPNYWTVQYDAENPCITLAIWLWQVKEMRRLLAARNALLIKHKVRGYYDLPPEVQAQYPPITLIIDEADSVFGKVRAPGVKRAATGPDEQEYRAALAMSVSRLAKECRKWGGHIAKANQIQYGGGATLLPPGTNGQFGFGLLLGAANATFRRMFFGFSEPWPVVTKGRRVFGKPRSSFGRGVIGIANEPEETHECRVPADDYDRHRYLLGVMAQGWVEARPELARPGSTSSRDRVAA